MTPIQMKSPVTERTPQAPTTGRAPRKGGYWYVSINGGPRRRLI